MLLYRCLITNLQTLQGHKACNGETINDVLFSGSGVLSLFSWGSRAGGGGRALTLPLRVGGEVAHWAFNVVIPYPICSPLPVPLWPRLPLLPQATWSRDIRVLHTEYPSKNPQVVKSQAVTPLELHLSVKAPQRKPPQYPIQRYQLFRSNSCELYALVRAATSQSR